MTPSPIKQNKERCVCGKSPRLATNKFCSKRCYWDSLKGIKDVNAPNWRPVVGKSQVHKWLVVHFGNPKTCEGRGCQGKSSWYDWALKTGSRYERKRENFLRLCRSCHRKYDLTPEKKKQAIKNLMLHNPYAKVERYKRFLV